MGAYLVTIVIAFLATTLFGHVIHWSLHQKWTGRFNRSHMTHHLKLYPHTDFYSEKYREAGRDSTVLIFGVAALPLLIVPPLLGLFGILSWPLVITALVTELTLGFLHDYIHDAFHIEKHWMARAPVVRDIFGLWVSLHYLHHVDMSKNYGIFVFHWDRIFRTHWRDDSRNVELRAQRMR